MSGKISRRTAQLFDLMFKSIIKDASSSAGLSKNILSLANWRKLFLT